MFHLSKAVQQNCSADNTPSKYVAVSYFVKILSELSVNWKALLYRSYLVIRTFSLSTKECGNWEQFGRKYVALKGTIVPRILLFSVFPSWRYDFSSGSSQVLSFYRKFLHSLTWKSWNKLGRLICLLIKFNVLWTVN